MDLPSTWDDLRKQARKLEGQLDEQLTSYRRVANTKGEGSEQDHEAGIERLLQQLQHVNTQMQVWVASGSSDILSHTLTRHREIFHDLSQEFIRLRSSLRARREHTALLENFSKFDHASSDLERNTDSAEQALLKEQATLQRSTVQIDNVVLQAQATLGALMFQRSTFGGISSKISNIGSRLPSVNHILSAIRRKKSMDTIILSLVASTCTVFILIYWLSKVVRFRNYWNKRYLTSCSYFWTFVLQLLMLQFMSKIIILIFVSQIVSSIGCSGPQFLLGPKTAFIEVQGLLIFLACKPIRGSSVQHRLLGLFKTFLVCVGNIWLHATAMLRLGAEACS